MISGLLCLPYEYPQNASLKFPSVATSFDISPLRFIGVNGVSGVIWIVCFLIWYCLQPYRDMFTGTPSFVYFSPCGEVLSHFRYGGQTNHTLEVERRAVVRIGRRDTNVHIQGLRAISATTVSTATHRRDTQTRRGVIVIVAIAIISG